MADIQIDPRAKRKYKPRACRDPRDRLMEKVTFTAYGCWEWSYSRARNGYGQFFFEGKMRWAHRVAYLLFEGSIPDGLEIDHLCRNRACVYPNHLEPVTRSENSRRGLAPALTRARSREECRNGHPLTPENTYKYERKGYACRSCVICRQGATRRDTAKRKEARHGN